MSARQAAGPALAALAAPALWRLLPTPDPFRGTLSVLPLVVAGLLALGAWARAHGGRPTPRPVATAEVAALGVLVVLMASARRLSLPGAEPALAAGLFLWLAHRAARLLLQLRPALGRRLPERPPAAFFWLPLLVYLAILPWSTERRPPDGDEPYYLLITHSLAYDGDADLAHNYARGDAAYFLDRPLKPQPGDPKGPGGEQYSRHNAALPLLLVPAYRLAGKLGALAVMAALTAALAWATLRLGRHYAPQRPGEVLAAYALLALAPPLLLYSLQVWIEVPAALLAVLALDETLALERSATRWQWVRLATLLALLPLLKLRFLLIGAPLVALGLARSGRRDRRHLRAVVLVAMVLAAIAAAVLLFNAERFGNPLKYRSADEIALYKYPLEAFARGTIGLFFDAAFGLFACAPVWALLLPALVLAIGRRLPAAGHLAFVGGPYLLFVVPRLEWYAGWSPPFRYGLLLSPFLALALVPLLAERRRTGARFLIAGLAAATLVLTLLWVAVPGWTYNLADGTTHVLDRLAERFGADVARLVPSAVRPRPATWIWPTVGLLATCALWWLPRGRRAAAAAVAGIAAAMLTLPALLFAANHLPTRRIEFEDGQVRASGGHLHPDLWVTARPRFRGGWVLPVGQRLEAPVVPGGKRATITLEAQTPRPSTSPLEIELLAGTRLLHAWPACATRTWCRLEVGPVEWPPAAPLVVRVGGEPGRGAVLFDRARLRWE